MNQSAGTAARSAADRPAFKKGARVGYAANGLINIIIGWIALQIALGGGGGEGEASASGAIRTLAESTVGSVLLWISLVGFALLGLWQLVTAALVKGETKDRVKAAAKGITYLVLGFLTLQILTGSGGGSGGASGPTATLMAQPFGRILVGAIGLGVVAVGVYQMIKGWKKKFLRDLVGNPGHWAVRAGQAGYVARGFAFVIVGGLLVAAAVGIDASQGQGLDAALQTLREAPFGKILLAIVAIGFMAFGVYSFARAKYARL